MTSYLASLLRRAGKRRAYASLMQLDDHLLRDIGLTRTDLALMRAGRHGETAPAVRAHE